MSLASSKSSFQKCSIQLAGHSCPEIISSLGFEDTVCNRGPAVLIRLPRGAQEQISSSCQACWRPTARCSVYLRGLPSDGQTVLPKLHPGKPISKDWLMRGCKVQAPLPQFGTTLEDDPSPRAPSWMGQAEASVATASHLNFSLCSLAFFLSFKELLPRPPKSPSQHLFPGHLTQPSLLVFLLPCFLPPGFLTSTFLYIVIPHVSVPQRR